MDLGFRKLISKICFSNLYQISQFIFYNIFRILKPHQIELQIAFFFSFLLLGLAGHSQFIENKGQWNKEVKFMTNAGDGSFYLHQSGYTITQYDPEQVKNYRQMNHEPSSTFKMETETGKIKAHAYKVEFLNALKPEIVPEKPLDTYNNYFIGNDATKWASNCKIYQTIVYKNIYPGVDLRYYVDNGQRLKYDLVVHPGASVDQIAMKYSGVNKMEVVKKELVVTTSLGKSRELEPFTYQTINNLRKEVDCKYEIKDNVVRFKIKNYSPSETLIIDPTYIFFSYSGSTDDNWGFTATYGQDGSLYGGGIVFGSGFPVSPGSYDVTFNGMEDIAIIKLSSDGTKRIYATYIGGSGREQPHSLIEDSKGNLIVVGRTNSLNYPATVPRVGPGSVINANKDDDVSGYDIIVSKLSADGAAMVGSLIIGGSGNDGVNIVDRFYNQTRSLKRNYGDDARSEVVIDEKDDIYLTSSTQSGDFPVSTNAFQKTIGGNQDAVILKINAQCNKVLFSTYFGGNEDDAGYVISLGNNNNIFIAGGTKSTNLFRNTPTNTVKPNYSTPSTLNSDSCDGFIFEISNDGTTAIRGTYLGTSKPDQIYGIEIDKNNYVYVSGTSEGDMPVINAAYFNQGAKQFITKLSPELDKIIYQTVFGSVNSPVPNISPTAFLVDRCENVYVSGWGGNVNQSYRGGNVRGMPITPDAYKPQTESGSNFYFFVMKKDASDILYGSYFGETGINRVGDHVDGGTSRFDKNGVIYQAVCADCGGTSFGSIQGNPGVWFPKNGAIPKSGSNQCNLGMIKIEMDFTGIKSKIKSYIDDVADSSGCLPLTVRFTDSLKMGKTYYWDFGDGSPVISTTTPEVAHTYNSLGQFTVKLISEDLSTCNERDSSFVKIKVGENAVVPSFAYNKLLPCESLNYQFTNKSYNEKGVPFSANTFTWDFGDGTAPITRADTSQFSHQFSAPGNYRVRLTVNDPQFCNSPVTKDSIIRVAPLVKAMFALPEIGCAPFTINFKNESQAGQRFEWYFGDGSPVSTQENPTHTFGVGTFTIKLIAYDDQSCNKVDSLERTIKISPNASAAFTFNPLQPKENTPVNFTNLSTGATSYLWNFGDGDSSTLVNPSHIFPSTGTYNVCLSAINSEGCASDTCMEVSAIIVPALDVPSAFAPAQGGINSKIFVKGFGIRNMSWVIYNRWGQKVFESNSPSIGWDGKYKGVLQPMDVYAYTLEVTFTDGKTVRKTGDITLLK